MLSVKRHDISWRKGKGVFIYHSLHTWARFVLVPQDIKQTESDMHISIIRWMNNTWLNQYHTLLTKSYNVQKRSVYLRVKRVTSALFNLQFANDVQIWFSHVPRRLSLIGIWIGKEIRLMAWKNLNIPPKQIAYIFPAMLRGAFIVWTGQKRQPV